MKPPFPVTQPPQPYSYQGFLEAPKDDKTYVRRNGDWLEVTVGIGEQGPPGPQGVQGPIGPPGPQGMIGHDGVTGPSGPMGPPGIDGATGPAGTAGATGPQGAQGATGATGAPGPQGTPGAQGQDGITGPQGPMGPQGPQGPAGPPGSSNTGDMTKAVYDTNGNNIVDAAEAVPWTGVTGKPLTFPPDSTAMLKATYDANGNGIVDSAESVAWTGVTGKPSTYPPDSTAMLRSVYDTNLDGIVDQAAAVAWTGVTGKPTTFAPSAHASTHRSGGSDVLALDTLGATTDITNLNASVTAHGLLPKLSGTATTYFNGIGGYSTPPAGGLPISNTTASFTVPAVNGTVAIAVDTTAGWTLYTYCYVNNLASFMVYGITSSTAMTIRNMGGLNSLAPGTVVIANTPVTFQGIQRPVACALSSACNVGAIGSGNQVSVTNTADWITVGQWVSFDGYGTALVQSSGAAQQGVFYITSGSGTMLPNITIPAGTMVRLAPDPAIISGLRLRSYNAIGNSAFEIDQWNCSTNLLTAASTPARAIDRWFTQRSATLTAVVGTRLIAPASSIIVPGTNFTISRSYLEINVSTAQATLAAGDYFALVQNVEGCCLRELLNDVSSLQILMMSNVSSPQISLFIRDSLSKASFVVPLVITYTGSYALYTVPNIPVFPALNGAVWNGAFGTAGCSVGICLGAGSTFTAPSNSQWVSGNYLGAAGNNGLSATGSFLLSFFQWEPGSLCTTPIDYPWIKNYQDCLRYYCKHGSYGSKFPDSTWQLIGNGFGGNAYVRCGTRFPRPMAKPPTVRVTGNTTTLNQVYYDSTGALLATTAVNVMDDVINNITLSGTVPGTQLGSVLAGWDADTGW
jgi:hypothetical protein